MKLDNSVLALLKCKSTPRFKIKLPKVPCNKLVINDNISLNLNLHEEKLLRSEDEKYKMKYSPYINLFKQLPSRITCTLSRHKKSKTRVDIPSAVKTMRSSRNCPISPISPKTGRQLIKNMLKFRKIPNKRYMVTSKNFSTMYNNLLRDKRILQAEKKTNKTIETLRIIIEGCNEIEAMPAKEEVIMNLNSLGRMMKKVKLCKSSLESQKKKLESTFQIFTPNSITKEDYIELKRKKEKNQLTLSKMMRNKTRSDSLKANAKTAKFRNYVYKLLCGK